MKKKTFIVRTMQNNNGPYIECACDIIIQAYKTREKSFELIV